MPIALIYWLHSLSVVVAAYLLGSIPTGYLLMRFFRKQDIRSIGSGNIGATNVLRSGAKGLGAATFVLDALKGALAVLLGAKLASYGFPPIPLHNAEALAAICAVLGHMFPIWLSLKGGKGVATGFGVFLAIAPWAALAAISVFALTLAISRYVSLASVLGAGVFPVFAWFLSPWIQAQWPRNWLTMASAILVAGAIILKHEQNIRRLLAGTEYRFGTKKKTEGAE
jgi:glycerol-3-phosphate acyltransferase PlsY